MKLTAEQFEILTDAIQEAGADVRPYSGRAMFGESCLGVITDDIARTFMTVAVILIENEEQEALALLRNARSREDSLGKSGIVYFPTLLVEDDEEYEDELV